jgi:5-hydroxyisourate hydrolase
MSGITTHVLDTSRGKPAAGVPIVLAKKNAAGGFDEIGRGATDADGRLRTLLAEGTRLEAGVHRLTFDTGAYFASLGVDGFYPSVDVVFVVRNPAEHHHVPLLLNPFGYSTYRGS